jgi:predicted component of type VI protein secretion system
MIYKTVAAVALCAMLAACGSTAVVKQPVAVMPVTSSFAVGSLINAAAKDGDQPPEHFLSAVQGHLKNELAKESRLAAQPEASSAVVDVKVVSFRMRSGFARAMFGVFAGKDGIESEVTIRDAKSGQVLGSSIVSSFNVMAIGGEEDVARMHGQEIAKFVLNKAPTK